MTAEEKAKIYERCGELQRRLEEVKHTVAAIDSSDSDAIMRGLARCNVFKCTLKKERDKVNNQYGSGTFERLMRESVAIM